MFFEFIRNRVTVTQGNRINEVETMLAGTWDLTKIWPVREGDPDAGALHAFNCFFTKLNTTMTAILKRVVALASLSPELFSLSKAFRSKAVEQAAMANEISQAGSRISDGIEDISGNTGHLISDFSDIKTDVEKALDSGNKSIEGFAEIKEQMAILVEAISILKENSASIGSISDTINGISDETNILSLNARIEAARGKTDGKGFKVIAEEVGHLAHASKEATKDIRDRLTYLGDKISETVDAVSRVEQNVSVCEGQILDANKALSHVCSRFGILSQNLSDINEATDRQSSDVKAVARSIRDIESAINRQSQDAESIFNIAERINKTCDRMILDTGVFHISGHGKASHAALEMAEDGILISGRRRQREKALAGYIARLPFIELAYITDARGRQVTANIYNPGIEDQSGLGKGFNRDWSEKEWFKTPMETGTEFVSQVYRSSATREFCFTVSVLLRRDQKVTGVLGVDVNFRDMLDI